MTDAPPVAPHAGTGNGLATEEPPPHPQGKPAPAAPPPDLTEGTPLEQLQKHVDRIRELRARTDFHEAALLARDAYSEYRELADTSAFDDLRALRAQIGREQRDAASLRAAYRDLGSDRSRRREVAIGMLEKAGELGNLFLRRAVREGNPVAARTAAPALLNTVTPNPADLLAIIKRALRSHDGETRSELMVLLRRNAQTVPFDGVLMLARSAGRTGTSPALRQQIEELLAVVSAERDFPGESLRSLYEGVRDDDGFAMRFAADYLATVFQFRAQMDADVFDELLGAPGATTALREYAEKAEASDQTEIAEWGAQFATRMSNLITVGLQIMATADEDPLDAQGNPVEFELTGGVSVVDGGALGKAYRFEGASGVKQNAVSFGPNPTLNSRNDFTVSIWFLREKNRREDTNHSVHNVLLAHSSDHSNDNLEIGSYGADLTVYIDSEGNDGTKAIPAGIADGRWHHVALTYDADRNRVARLYVDGAPRDVSLPWGGRLSQGAENSPLTLGNSFHHETPLHGRIDEFFLYDRALSDREIQILYHRAPEARRSTNP